MNRSEIESLLVQVLNTNTLSEIECEAIREAIKRMNDLEIVSEALDFIVDKCGRTYGCEHGIKVAYDYCREMGIYNKK